MWQVTSRRTLLAGFASAGATLAAAALAAAQDGRKSASLRRFGAVGDGRADASAAFESAVQSGYSIIDIPAGEFRITRQILVPSGVLLRGTGESTIVLDIGAFDETSPAKCYAQNACALMFHGNTGGGVDQLKFAPSAYGPELVVMAIALRACTGVRIDDCEFQGFSKSKIVRVDSSRACRLVRNDFHDCHLASAGAAQLTCIDVDDNRIAGGSEDLAITKNTIRGITSAPEFMRKFGDQTDGINISHESSSGHLIADNSINGVGEGIDCFGQRCIIRDNELQNCRNYAVKLIHGARKNRVERNRISRPGLGGIVIAGSTGAMHHTEQNVIENNLISGAGAGGDWSRASTFGIKLEDDHGARVARNNIIRNNHIVEGERMAIGILSADKSSGNVIHDNRIEGPLSP